MLATMEMISHRADKPQNVKPSTKYGRICGMQKARQWRITTAISPSQAITLRAIMAGNKKSRISCDRDGQAESKSKKRGGVRKH
jgi:hypothetical protein